MLIIYVVLVLLLMMVISLGVGSSTIAIINFFVAIADGNIDPQERAMMGVVYKVLRVAMILIPIVAILLALVLVSMGVPYLSDFTISFWTLILVLYANAFLMTKHIIPSNFGPAIQAGTWYTLGIMMSLSYIDLSNFAYYQFLIGYLAALALAVAIVNTIMAMFKKRQQA